MKKNFYKNGVAMAIIASMTLSAVPVIAFDGDTPAESSSAGETTGATETGATTETGGTNETTETKDETLEKPSRDTIADKIGGAIEP